MTAITTPTVPAAVPQVLTLMWRTLNERWRSTFGWGLGLVLMAVLQLAVYPSVAKSSASMQEFVDQWPEAFRQAFNLDAYTTGAGFLNAEMFSMMVPLVLIAVAVSGAAAATAAEEERGTADLLLSLPVSRGRVVVAKVLATVIAVLLVAAATLLAIAVGAPLVDLEVGLADLAAGVLMTALLALFFGAVALLVATVTGKRAVALGTAVGLALAAFLLNALAPMADWLEPWQKASPFYWALGDNPLINGVDAPMAGLLLVAAVALVVLADVAYRRRDIGGR
ncbi:MAG: ABC transporter permease subunit [Candidatus Nanopelagicales bacterium]